MASLPKLPTASVTTNLSVEYVFCLHGIALEIVSDRGPEFVSQGWRDFWSALGAKVSLRSGFQIQTNGQIERLNQELEATLEATLEVTLRCVAWGNASSWSFYLPWVKYAHNSHTSATTNHQINAIQSNNLIIHQVSKAYRAENNNFSFIMQAFMS